MPLPLAAGRGRDHVEKAEAEVGRVHEQREAAQPIPSVLRGQEDRAEAMLDRIAQQIRELQDVPLGHAPELGAEDGLRLADHRPVRVRPAIENTADAKHRRLSG